MNIMIFDKYVLSYSQAYLHQIKPELESTAVKYISTRNYYNKGKKYLLLELRSTPI